MKKKRVVVYQPKAQDGMEMGAPAQQPMGPPAEQQQGADQQLQQLAQQVQQMMDQGAAPEQVVAQLLQGGVPPEAIMQVFVGLGMPQEQVQPLIEGVMQQMQGGQGPEGQPPAQEGAPEEQPMMAEGGQTSEQEQQAIMQQMIMLFAQINQVDPEQVVQQLQSGELTMEQIDKTLQESPEVQQMMQQQGGAGQQPMMFHGGVTTSNPGAFISPNKEDFASITKKMKKEIMAKGGETDALDSSSTEALIQNLKGTISNYVSKNMRLGLVNERAKANNALFDEIPAADNGLSPEEQAEFDKMKAERESMIAGYKDTPWADIRSGYESGSINAGQYMLLSEAYKDKKAEWVKTQGGGDQGGGSGDGNNSDMYKTPANPGESLSAYIMRTTGENTQGMYANTVWDGTKWVNAGQGYQNYAQGGWGSNIAYGDGMGGPAYGGDPYLQHYYPGWGPGMPNSGYGYERFLTTPLGQMLSSRGKIPGQVNMTGIDGLKGMNQQQLMAAISEVMKDPNAHNARWEDITKNRWLRKDKVIGKRLVWDPITGEQKEVDEPNAERSNMVEATDEQGNKVRMSLEEAENRGLAHKIIPNEFYTEDKVNTEDDEYPITDKRGNLLQYREPNRRSKWERRDDRLMKKAEEESFGTLKDTEAAMSPEQLKLLYADDEKGYQKALAKRNEGIIKAQRKADRKHIRNATHDKKYLREQFNEKYGKKANGGELTGGIIWDFEKRRFVNAPKQALFQAAKGVEFEQDYEKLFDPQLFTEGLMGSLGWLNNKMTAARMNQPSWVATDERALENMVPTGPGGKRGLYDQEGRFRPDDMGAQVLPGTIDWSTMSSGQQKNLYNDLLTGGGMRYYADGGLVGDVQFTQQELEELAKLGYNISRR